ncbi:MAG: HlyD family efflux transporter periplasmic adaptor subunit [Anaerolineales bacterium]|nr:HlyD family efflux transporter periplasmic adaptor subunit [Anaerolineales bacterium]
MMLRSNRMKFLSLMFVAGLLLSACGGNNSPTPDVETDVEAVFVPIVSATGVVVPRKWAMLSLPIAGIVEETLVSEGDWVEEGQELIRLKGREQVEANLAAARLEQIGAQQALDILIEEADMVSAQTGMLLAQSRDALEDAIYNHSVRQEGNRASQATLDAASANLVLAENEVDRAEAAFERVENRSKDSPARALALSQLAAAQSKRDSILRNLNWYTGHPTEVEQGLLDAEVALAEAQVQQAEMDWERVKDGPDSRALELAKARLANAEALVAAAEAALEQLIVTAPFSGFITELHVRANEWVAPGQPVLLLAQLQDLRIETTDLNEIDVTQVNVGDKAIITFDALPDVVTTGTVNSIGLKAAEGSGVNYPVVIELDALPEEIRWGMTAFVDVEIGS